jgi:flavin reductase
VKSCQGVVTSRRVTKLHNTRSALSVGQPSEPILDAYGRPEQHPEAATDHADAFRVTMRRAAAGVAIITTSQGGVDYGMTATAFASVSMAPPMLLIVVNETASLYGPLCKSKRFCINILGADQENIGRRFSTKPSDQSRFQSGQWLRDAHSPARLLEATGWIDCAVDSIVHAATHAIFIGRVIDARSFAAKPLVYFDGRYAQLSE